MESNEPRYRTLLKKMAYRLGRICPIKPQDITEGTELCRMLQERNLFTTLGKLSKSGDDPAEVVRDYLLASNALPSLPAGDSFYLSVKPPALNFDLGHAEAIATAALLDGHGVHFDSHKFDQADATLQLLADVLQKNLPAKETRRSWNFSLSLPSRWKRSVADARWAAEKGLRVRVVKGDFAGAPADELDPARGFLDLVDRLAGKAPALALATHDCLLARDAIDRCRKAGAPVQLELFFGRPASGILALAREKEVPVGFYVPYGDTLLVYVIRDLLTNPHQLLRRDSFEILGSPKTKLDRITGDL